MWPRCRQRTRTAQRLRQNLAALRGRYQALGAGVLLAEPNQGAASSAPTTRNNIFMTAIRTVNMLWERKTRGSYPVSRFALDDTGTLTVALPRPLETMVWLPAPRALVPGDRLIGGRRGGVRPCPDSWLPRGVDGRALRKSLRVLLDLPVGMVLVSHGRPVLRGGRAAIAKAL